MAATMSIGRRGFVDMPERCGNAILGNLSPPDLTSVMKVSKAYRDLARSSCRSQAFACYDFPPERIAYLREGGTQDRNLLDLLRIRAPVEQAQVVIRFPRMDSPQEWTDHPKFRELREKEALIVALSCRCRGEGAAIIKFVNPPPSSTPDQDVIAYLLRPISRSPDPRCIVVKRTQVDSFQDLPSEQAELIIKSIDPKIQVIRRPAKMPAAAAPSATTS